MYRYTHNYIYIFICIDIHIIIYIHKGFGSRVTQLTKGALTRQPQWVLRHDPRAIGGVAALLAAFALVLCVHWAGTQHHCFAHLSPALHLWPGRVFRIAIIA